MKSLLKFLPFILLLPGCSAPPPKKPDCFKQVVIALSVERCITLPNCTTTPKDIVDFINAKMDAEKRCEITLPAMDEGLTQKMPEKSLGVPQSRYPLSADT